MHWLEADVTTAVQTGSWSCSRNPLVSETSITRLEHRTLSMGSRASEHCLCRAPIMMDPNQQGHQATAIVSAFNRWRLEHALVAIRVRDALNNSAPESVLRALVEEARGQLWALFAMKKVGQATSSALAASGLDCSCMDWSNFTEDCHASGNIEMPQSLAVLTKIYSILWGTFCKGRTAGRWVIEETFRIGRVYIIVASIEN